MLCLRMSMNPCRGDKGSDTAAAGCTRQQSLDSCKLRATPTYTQHGIFSQSRTKHTQHPDAHSSVFHTFQTSRSMPGPVCIPNTLKTTTRRSHAAFSLHSQERKPNNNKQSNHHKPQSAMSFPVAASLYRDMGDALNKLVQRAQGTQLPTLTPARRHKHSAEPPR